MNIPSVPDVLAALFGAAGPRPETELEVHGPCDRIAEPEPEAEP